MSLGLVSKINFAMRKRYRVYTHHQVEVGKANYCLNQKQNALKPRQSGYNVDLSSSADYKLAKNYYTMPIWPSICR